jgi:hypothetical protein
MGKRRRSALQITRELDGISGGLNLSLNTLGLRSGMQGTGVYAQDREQCLAAGVGHKNTKGEGGKYSTGKA